MIKSGTQLTNSPRHVRATLLAPYLAPALAGALFALWVVAHVVWRVVR